MDASESLASSSDDSEDDSEAAVITNAKVRGDPAERANRRDIRTAQREFAPGGEGACAAARHFASLLPVHCSQNARVTLMCALTNFLSLV